MRPRLNPQQWPLIESETHSGAENSPIIDEKKSPNSNLSSGHFDEIYREGDKNEADQDFEPNLSKFEENKEEDGKKSEDIRVNNEISMQTKYVILQF